MKAEQQSYATEAFSGVSWTSLSQTVRRIANFLTAIVLARLLIPEDFGLVSMASVAVGFVALFRDLGTSSVLVQKKEVNDVFLSSIAWLNCFIGLVLMAVLLVVAPIVAKFFEEPLLGVLIPALAFNLLVSCLSIVPIALMIRDLRFSQVAKIDIVASFAGAVFGIAMAWQGAGVWALIVQSMIATFVTLLLATFLGRGWPGKFFDWEEITPIIRYSLNLTGFNLVNYCVRNLDNLIIGKILGAQSLGYYSLAYRLLMLPLQSISDVANRVMFPILAKMQEDLELLRVNYKRMLGKIALFTFPMMLGLWVVRENFVVIIYGDAWLPAASLLLFLAPIGLIQSIGTTVGLIYQIKGRTDLMFYWGIGVGCLLLPTFWIGAQYGLNGVAIAYAATSCLLAVPTFVFPCRLIEMPLSDIPKSVLPVLGPALIMAIIVFFAKFSFDKPTLGALLCLVSLGIISYGTMLHLMKVKVYLDVRDFLMKMISSSKGPVVTDNAEE